MNKPAQYILVNATRIFEGMLKNHMPPGNKIIAMSSEQMAQAVLFPTNIEKGIIPEGGKKASAVSASVTDVRERVSQLLSASLSEPVHAPTDPRPAPGNDGHVDRIWEPDCILYHLSESEDVDEKLVRRIRRKCSFRDIPIFAVAAYKDLPRARKLIASGADEILVFPSQPELIVKKLSEALEPAGKRVPVITKIINPYIGATVDLLATMAGMHAEKKEVFLKKNYRLFGDISAIMTLSGKVTGEVVVCFEEKLAREVVSRIMACAPQTLTKDELREGIGEVVNIIAGNAKAALASSEYAHQIALPTVVLGHGHEIAHPGNSPCIVVIFEILGQPMAVLVSMTVS